MSSRRVVRIRFSSEILPPVTEIPQVLSSKFPTLGLVRA